MQFVQFYATGPTGAVLPGAEVSVYISGAETLATLSNEAGIGIENPLTAGNSGLYGFAAEDGDYDVVVSSGDETQPSFKVYLLDPVDVGASIAAAQTAANAASASAAAANETAGQASSDSTDAQTALAVAQAQVLAAQQAAQSALDQVTEANTSLLTAIANANGQAQTAILQVNENTENLVTISATVASNTSAITTNYATLTTSVSSLTGTVNTLSSTVTTNNSTQSANLSSEAVTRADADSALSASITSLTSTVNSNTATISSDNTTLTNSISALSSTVTSLSSTVSGNTATITANYATLSGQLSTQAAEITTLQSNYGSLSSTVSSNYTSLSSAQASTAAAVTTLTSQVFANPNMLPYGNFEAGLSVGWTFQIYGGAATEGYVYADPNYGQLAFVGYTTTPYSIFGLTSGVIQCAGNQVYTLSGNIQSPPGGTCYLDRLYFNSSGTLIDDGAQTQSTLILTESGGYNYSYTEQAPATATAMQVRAVFYKANTTTQENAYAQHLKLEQGSVATPYTTEATSYAVSAAISSEAVTRATADSALSSSITSLTATVGSNTASISSQAIAISSLQSATAIYLDEVSTSGGITLVQLASSSITGTSILLQANKVYFGPGIVADETTTTIQITEAGYMKVAGAGFGSSNQFIEWFGPAMALSSMTEANATYYLKKDGSAYFGGSLSAGTLTNGISTSSTSATASTETAIFGSNGNTITVTLSYTYNDSNVVDFAAGASGHTAWTNSVNYYGGTISGGSCTGAGSDPGPFTIVLSRSVNGGAFSNVATLTGTGSWTISGDAPTGVDVGYIIITDNASGSLTYTDPDHSTENRQYQATITGRNPEDASGIVQRLSITCVEQ